MTFDPSAWAFVRPTTALTTPTHDGSGEAVHPDVIDFGSGETWNGYRYWMAMTPYPGSVEEYEFPNILASADGDTWVVPDGLTNPIEAYPGGSAAGMDPNLLYRATDDKLYLIHMSPAVADFGVRSSADGVTWSAPVAIGAVAGSWGDIVSPVIVELASNSYRLYYVSKAIAGNTIQYRTSTTPDGTWSATPVNCTLSFTPYGMSPWHIHIVKYAGGYLALVMFCNINTSGANGQSRLAWSADGVAWTVADYDQLYSGTGQWDDANYRGSIVPNLANNRIECWYSGYVGSGPSVWHIGRGYFEPHVTVSPIGSNFADLTGWTASGTAAASNLVAASEGGTTGTAYKTGPRKPNEARIAFDVIPDKDDTAGRYALAGQTDTAGNGFMAGYVAGAGLVCAYYAGGAVAAQTVILTDASVVDGRRYHIEATYRIRRGAANVNWSICATAYDTTLRHEAQWVGGHMYGATNSFLTRFDRLGIVTNSAASKIGRYGYSGTYLPTGAAREFCSHTAYALRSSGTGTSAVKDYTLVLPGGMRTETPAVFACYCNPYWLGLGQEALDGIEGNPSGRGGGIQVAMPYLLSLAAMGVPAIVPRQYSTLRTTSYLNYGGAPEIHQEIADAIDDARDIFGDDAEVVLIGHGSGALNALATVARGLVTGVQGMVLHYPVTGLQAAYSVSAWQANIRAAFGTGSSAPDYTLYDPHVLIAADPTVLDDCTIAIVASSADTVFPPATFATPFMAILDTAGIPYDYRLESVPTGTSVPNAATVQHALAVVFGAPLPPAADVTNGTEYGVTRSGSLVVPATGDVRSGVAFGAAGVEVGSLVLVEQPPTRRVMQSSAVVRRI